MKKKLIEVALPLEAINFQAAREKSIRHGHPSTLHLWWARRPLAACRAVLFSSLVDDPSSHPEQFPTEEAQEEERQRLFRLIEKLVDWDNIKDEKLYKEAYEEILKSTDGNPPPVLDPFAGGGSIPLEAQRLGLEAHASDLNPVAVLINKALIEIPPRFKDMAPVNPKYRKEVGNSPLKGAGALADDVKYYGEWMRQKAFEKIGHLYPRVKLPEGEEATVIAWIWARTLKCPNPACGAEMPLVHSFELSKKRGHEAWTKPVVGKDKKSVGFEIQQGKGKVPEGTVNRQGARCICCGEPVGFPYIREESKSGRMSARMMAIVADGPGGRIYLSPNEVHITTANVSKPKNYPDGELAYYPGHLNTKVYGLTHFNMLFSHRQLTALVTFSDLIAEAIVQAKENALTVGLSSDDMGLDRGGSGAQAYGEAVGVYLSFMVDKLLDRCSAICSWDVTRDGIRNTFGRQAIPMVWDFAEANPFSQSSGCWDNCKEWVYKCIKHFTPNTPGYVVQRSATQISLDIPIIISTDPPYYDNIGYADLSDFFYIWLRRSLQKVFPKLLSTMLVPKTEELVATPYRFKGGKEEAKIFFENGMFQSFSQMRKTVSPDFPLTVYYAFKQSEHEDDGKINIEGNQKDTVSTGWETMLQALINASFAITGTWPLRTEMSNRTIASNANALASSIAIVCRPRQDDAPSTTRRAFQTELREALKTGLHDLQSGNIAPVDLAQASIGPGIAVYSKYKEVLEADGNPMSVRQALVMINQELDAYLSAQEGSMDSNSRFCIAWFEEYGLEAADYGRAETLAKAKLSHIQDLVDEGMLESGRGKVRLIKRDELPEDWSIGKVKSIWAMVQGLCHAMDTGGKDKAAALMAEISRSNPGDIENIKALAYRAYMVAERKGWTPEALAYNSLVSLWSDLTSTMNELNKRAPKPQELEF